MPIIMHRMPVGPCEEIRSVAVFMPSLLKRFAEADRQSGAPLTHSQAQDIRNTAVHVLVSEETASKLQQRRGFLDLVPTTSGPSGSSNRKRSKLHSKISSFSDSSKKGSGEGVPPLP